MLTPGLDHTCNHQQYVSISEIDSELRSLTYIVPQGSILGPLLFLIYINDLHAAIKYYLIHDFADDTNLLPVDNSWSIKSR